MGKLHRIRRAFDKVTEQQKKHIWQHGSGCKFLDDGSVHFTLYYLDVHSYQRYIAKLAEAWMRKTYGRKGEVAQRD